MKTIIFSAAILAAALFTGTAHADPLAGNGPRNGGGSCWLKIRTQAAQATKDSIPFVGVGRGCKVQLLANANKAQAEYGIPEGAVFTAGELANRDDADEATSAIVWRLAGIVHKDAYVVVVHEDEVEYPRVAATYKEAADIAADAEQRENGFADIYHTSND